MAKPTHQLTVVTQTGVVDSGQGHSQVESWGTCWATVEIMATTDITDHTLAGGEGEATGGQDGALAGEQDGEIVLGQVGARAGVPQFGQPLLAVQDSPQLQGVVGQGLRQGLVAPLGDKLHRL